ncbi:MAG TPA: DUF5615 family PIN-like protein [Candidatus Polarisedimenticolaceae bacterium]|nr:DUF5615 family PIN-like protein [Candidatus Polarisedimenticolaceae bacterium]
MRIKLDENLGSPRFCDPLRAAGHDVATVQEQGLHGEADDGLDRVCQSEDRCLVTLDLGFADSVRYVPSARPGIVVLRVPARVTFAAIDAALATFVDALTRTDVRGKLWVVQGRRVREHQTD